MRFSQSKHIRSFSLIFNYIFTSCLFGMWNLQLNNKLNIGFKLESEEYEGFTTSCYICYWIFLSLNLLLFTFYLFSLIQKFTKKYLHFLLFYFPFFLTLSLPILFVFVVTSLWIGLPDLYYIWSPTGTPLGVNHLSFLSIH